MKPDSSTQAAPQQSPTAAARPTVGDSPTAAAASGPWLRGRYSGYAAYTGTRGIPITVTSDCPGCDAIAVVNGNTNHFRWDGNGWQNVQDGPCGQITGVATPTAVADGFVQELSIRMEGGCDPGRLWGTWTRIGD